jgi:EmrB/QacA subfamily drug resistance transporter
MTHSRLVLLIAIMASFVALLDGSVINVALTPISKELGGGLATQQWVVDAYAITLGAFMLTAGALSDVFGRKRILIYGLMGFGATSLLCAFSPTDEVLILSRALQGIAGALLIPSSLALIISEFSGRTQSKAIGTWTAWIGIAFLVGPLLGGFLVDIGSWRLIFAINVLPIGLTIWLISRLKSREERRPDSTIDIVGSVLAVIGLGGTAFGLIEGAHIGWINPGIIASLAIGVLSLIGFIIYERRTPKPMLPMNLFTSRNFSVGNMATFMVYAGLSIATFIITIFLQQVGHYSAFYAGLSLLPITIIMTLFSSKFGELSAIHGPRLFMGLGPIIGGIGFISMVLVDQDVSYWHILPGVVLFGTGLVMTVAPLTSAVLSSINEAQAGVGSAVNNAVSRISGLLAVAFVGIVTGPLVSIEAFQHGIILAAILLFAGGLVSLVGIVNPSNKKSTR